MNTPRFRIFVGKDGQYYFHLQAANGEIICSGEGYTTKQMCIKGIEAVKRVAPDAPIIEKD